MIPPRQRESASSMVRPARARVAPPLQGKMSQPTPVPPAPGVRADLGDAKLVSGMRTQCILRHKLLGNLASEAHLDAAGDIDLGQFLLLEFRVVHELPCSRVRDRHVRCRTAN